MSITTEQVYTRGSRRPDDPRNYVAAIDIGTTKIIAIIGKRNDKGKLEILGMGKAASKGVKRGVVLNIEETAQAIQEAVHQAEQMSGRTFHEVFVGIAGQHIKSIKNRGYKYINGPDDEITQADVDELTQDMYKIPIDAGEEIIHVIPQNYIVDSETGVKKPVGMSGKRLEANFHIVIGQIASAKNVKKCVNRVNLEVKSLILEPLASADAVLTDDEKEAGVALVDIGGGTTDIAVYYDGVIRHTAVIPFGGNVVTNDIKEGCSILHRYAEALKVQYGSALAEAAPEDKVVVIPGISGRDPKEISQKSLAHIIQARMEEIIDAITFEIENSGYLDKLGAGIALTGGGALLKHLPQLMKFRTGLDVRLAYPNAQFVGGSTQDTSQPIFSTSIGLLIKGMSMNGIEQEGALKAETKKQEPIQITEPIITKEAPKKQEKQPEQEEEEAPEKQEKEVRKTVRQKEGIINALKNTILDIFDERDTKM